jgi:hypothetical protein
LKFIPCSDYTGQVVTQDDGNSSVFSGVFVYVLLWSTGGSNPPLSAN